MMYYSSRGLSPAVSPAQAILEGLAPDGGLYTPRPEDLPRLNAEELLHCDNITMAAKILCAMFPDFSEEELLSMLHGAYDDSFPKDMTPIVPVGDSFMLELYHGPSSAFKDVALCLLPRLIRAAAEKQGNRDDITILTATSGDTGKAAMEGFKDVPGIRIAVFYPRDGVSAVQQAQMQTQAGGNVKVCAVEGNFDDAQSGVKRIFETVHGRGLSSANSINIGRLAPQIVYYFSAYAALLKAGKIKMGDKLDFAVPTGNFGDILAGYLAGELGLPVGRLICASNVNNVLSDFFRSGVYDRRRPLHKSTSPSMDILLSSNLERLLYLMSGDSGLVHGLMEQLRDEGCYRVPEALMEKLRERFWADCCSDEDAAATIAGLWKQQGYLCDTHTAVAWRVARQYRNQEGGNSPLVVLSTASAYKFPAAVLSALGERCDGDEFIMMERLEELSKVPMPENLRGLKSRPVLHKDCIRPDGMKDYVLKLLEEESRWIK